LISPYSCGKILRPIMGWYYTQFGFCFLVPTAYGGLLWVKTVRKTGGKKQNGGYCKC